MISMRAMVPSALRLLMAAGRGPDFTVGSLHALVLHPEPPLNASERDRVVCQLTPQDWRVGVVLRTLYTQRSFPAGRCAAYQVQLDDGPELLHGRDGVIFVPRDEEAAAAEGPGQQDARRLT